jgi:AhpD family alkylhydroperoxidase
MFAETIIDRMAKSIRYVRPVPAREAQGVTAEAYRQMQQDFLPVPLLTLHSPAPDIMAGVWSILRESLLAGRVSRTLKEAVAATVSKTNECPFCIDAHNLILHANDDHDVASAILRGDYDSLRDPQVKALVEWTLASRTAAGGSPLPAPADAMPEIVGTAITFHYINRVVNVFLGDTLLPLPSAIRGVTGRLLSATAGRRLVQRLEPGRSLKLIPQAALPDDLWWTAGSPAVAGAFAGLAAVVEAAGRQALPDEVRTLVSDRIQAWRGETLPMSRRWVEDAIAELQPELRAAARLALLTALASYQVDAGVIQAFQAQNSDDAHLIGAAAWASFAAARRVGVWLCLPQPERQQKHDYQIPSPLNPLPAAQLRRGQV